MPTKVQTESVAADVQRFVELLWEPGDVREVRIPKHNKYGHTASGYFDTPESLALAAAKWNGKANLYLTLNPVNPALLARSANRIADKAETTSSDTDVTRRRWLFIDIDPDRPAGISSTESERQEARAVLDDVVAYLESKGWPQPIVAMSGNGWYLLYQIDLPNDPPSLDLVKGALEGLATRFDRETAHIDTSVCNAARLVGLVGSLKVKGDSLPERPHRRSCLESIPQQITTVTEELLEVLTVERLEQEAGTPKNGSTTAGSTPALEALLQAQQIDYKVQPPDAQGITWYHVRRCPFHEAECRPFECGVGQKLPDGPYAGCFHAEDEPRGWKEWKSALGLSVGMNGRVRSKQKEPEFESASLRLTDTWNARRLVGENFERILWCEVFKQWFVYDGTRYTKDETREVERNAEAMVKGLYEYAASLPDKQDRQRVATWAMSSENRNRIVNLVESAKRMVPVHPNDFDTDPMLFNVLNGTIQLSTQTLEPHSSGDLITKRGKVTYDHDAECPLWFSFLDRIFAGNQELIDFVQRLFGYCLIGRINEHILVILYGTGANGKSTLLRLLRSLTGDYSYHCRPEVFSIKRNDSQGFELVPLAGTRVVTTSETSAGKRLDEALVKEMTGGEPITCAPKYGDFFTYQPAFKPLLATNHKPEIHGVDEGIWRRVLLLPFTVTIPRLDQDKHLPDKLEEELSGIFNWALEGVSEYLDRGLDPPEKVVAATTDYRAEQDILGSWIEDRCIVEPQASDEYGLLYGDYLSWCERNKEDPISKTRFSASLDERGCVSHRGAKGKRMRVGIARIQRMGDG